MEVAYAKEYGFCSGVKRAVSILENAVARSAAGEKYFPAPVYTLGPIVHNARVVKSFESRGVRVASFDELMSAEPATVVIRAHGIPKQQYDFLARNGHSIVDATCKNIVVQYRGIKNAGKEGYNIWFVEEKQKDGKTHPEIEAKMSRVCYVPRRVSSAADIPSKGNFGRVAIVPQTTFDTDEYGKILMALKPRTYEVRQVGSICPATRLRQAAAKELAKSTDAIVVVGGGLDGRPSNNTLELAKAVSSLNSRVLLVADASELEKMADELKGAHTVGITAGASTPNDVIEEVAEFLGKI
jgi:4-hydroxy-3-methylbut-2-enyl diphosphate reductase